MLVIPGRVLQGARARLRARLLLVPKVVGQRDYPVHLELGEFFRQALHDEPARAWEAKTARLIAPWSEPARAA